MGRVEIFCCGYGYCNYNTKGGEQGTWRCRKCGCVYGWRDVGGGKTMTWTEEPCPDHGFGFPQRRSRVVVCSRCKGTGEYYGYICTACDGTGYARV